MTGFLTTRRFLSTFEAEVQQASAAAGLTLQPILLPASPEERLDASVLPNIDIAFFSGDIVANGLGRSFFSSIQGAPNVQWMHVFNAGVDNPVFSRIKSKGVRISTSSGSTGVPIAQSAITGLLMLSRRFTLYVGAQTRKEWITPGADVLPDDLSIQTLTVVGLGAIGSEIARLGQALGMHVIGVRRSPRKPTDPVDEMITPDELASVLPRTNWLALATPLTEKTRRMIDAEAIAMLPRGACILNVGRGEVVDEQAMIAALGTGQLGGAYLDVFEVEPLPAESPLWEIPNVIISPHSSAISTGNEARAAGYFIRNLQAWGKNEPLVNEVE